MGYKVTKLQSSWRDAYLEMAGGVEMLNPEDWVLESRGEKKLFRCG